MIRNGRNEELRRLQQPASTPLPVLLWIILGAGLAVSMASFGFTMLYGTGGRVADRSSVDRNYDATRCAINLTLIPDADLARLTPTQLLSVCPDVDVTVRAVP